MWKNSSILDYQKKELCPQIWRNNKIKSGIKDFIINSIKGFFNEIDLEGVGYFVTNLYIGSSLATYFYKDDSDLDVKIVIDIDAFKKYHPEYKDQSDEDILDELIETGRKSFFLTNMIPGTMHPIDAYFSLPREATPPNLIKYDSLYDLLDDKWLKSPKKIDGIISPSYVLNYARNIAQKYIEKISDDIDQTKRDTIDFIMLRDYIKSLDSDDLKVMYNDYNNSLDKINDDIETLIEDKEIVKMLRKKAFNKDDLKSDLEKMLGSINYSDGNLIFKIIQRYGYLRILVEISDLFKDRDIEPDEVNEIVEII